MYKLLTILLLTNDYKLNEYQNKIILTNSRVKSNRAFDNYKQCYKFLKMMHYLF